jgi:tRNA dimethylallyltransferase
VIRALEVILTTGRPFSDQQHQEPPRYTAFRLALTADRAALHRAADRRIAAMLAGGLIEEVRQLLAAGYDFGMPALSAVGYREVAAYLGGTVSLDDARQRMERATHAYQRRQLTWFRADPRYHWLDVTTGPPFAAARDLVAAWRAGRAE